MRSLASRKRAASKLLQILLSILTVLGLLTVTAPAATAQQSAQAEAAEKSIVLVGITWVGTVEYNDENGVPTLSKAVEAYGRCTGFFAGTSGEVITARHCVDPDRGAAKVIKRFLEIIEQPDLLEGALRDWKVYSSAGKSGSVERIVRIVQPDEVEGAVVTKPAEVDVAALGASEGDDVALLRWATDKETPALAVATKTPGPGVPVLSTGFPGSVSDMVDSDSERATFVTGTTTGGQKYQGVPVTGVDANLQPGMSGGPTLANNEVIGVTSYGGDGFNFITDAAKLHNFITINNVKSAGSQSGQAAGGGSGVKVPSTLSAESEDSGTSPWIWVGAGLLALVVVGLLVGIPFLRRRKATHPYAQAGTHFVNCTKCGFGHNPPTANYCGQCNRPLRESAESADTTPLS